MTNNLKIEVLVSNIPEDGSFASQFPSQEYVNQQLAKKANLSPEGRLDPSHAPDYTEIPGLYEHIEDTKDEIGLSIASSLQDAKGYTNQQLSTGLQTKADLVNGKIPFDQIPFSADIEDQIQINVENITAVVDQKVAQVVGQVNQASTAANAYTDTKVAENRTYVDNTIGNVIEDVTTIVDTKTVSKAVTIPTYLTPEAGVAAGTGVAAGAYYIVRSTEDDTALVEYQNVGGSAVATGKTYPSASAVNELKEFTSVARKSEYAFTPSSAPDHTIELQEAIDYCAANFLNCKPIGLFKTSGKVVIKGEFDGSRCRVQTQVYGPITATPIAVEVSTGIGDNPTTIISLTESERIILPDVVNGTKPVTGWVGQGIGVRYVNVQNTQITERLVQDFAIGVQHTAYTQGCGYNTVIAGYLRNNKVNRQFVVGDVGGWTNRWDLYGGRYFHSSKEGVEVEGVMQFDVVPNTIGNIINDINHFGGSFEGITEQYHLRLGGAHINFWGIRFETSENNAPGGIKVHLASGGIAGQGSACGIHFGRGVAADNGDMTGVVRVTSDPSAGKRLTIQSTSGTTFKSVAGTGEIKQSTNSPADFLYSGVDPLYVYGQSITANYSFGISANELKAKRRTDAHDRVKIDFQNGRVYFGTGSVTPTYYVGQQGGTSLATNANWIPQVNAEYTLGAAGFAWDRLFLAKGFGAFGAAPLLAQPTITGKKTPATIAEQNAVLDSIISALSAYGLVVDNRT